MLQLRYLLADRPALVLGVTVFGVCALLQACGGGESPKSADDATTQSASDNSGVDDTFEDGDDAPPEEASAPADPCAQGTCSHCGDALCLDGFYCDESAQACAWLPECANSPTCDCIEKQLDGCSCEARDGGLYVTCQD